jgi:adenylate cyclase
MIHIGRPSLAAILTSGFVLLGLLWGGFLGAHQIAGVGSALDSLENLTLDWRFWLAGPRPAPRGVVIAAIDDDTIRQGGAYPLPRGVLARLIRGIADFNPQAIAIDIAFIDPGHDEDNRELAAALGTTRSVVAAIGLFDSGGPEETPRQSGALALVPTPSRVLWPIADIRAATRSGLVNMVTDAAGMPRHIPMIYRLGDDILQSFALATAAAALNTDVVIGPGALRIAARSTSTDLGYHLPIRYYGPHGSVRQFSAARILRGDLDPDDVRGQIVVLGATAVGTGDIFATPFDRVVPGVEVLATGISNILAGDGLVRTVPIRWIDAATAILLTCIIVLLTAMRRAFVGFALAALVFFVWGALNFLAFREGYWLSVAVPLAALVPVAVAHGTVRLGFDRYIAGRLMADQAVLTKFQSPLLVDYILKNPSFLENPVRQDVAVVFLDLSGFTGVAEALGPEWARDLLAHFQSLIERDVAAQGGFVVSFMGDGAMILFGLPKPKPDDASRALLAIRHLHASVAAWLEALPPVARDRLSCRIGGHSGPAAVSRLGAAHHQHITATGDTVNITSRLLEVAKQQACSIVVSEDIYLAGDASASFGDESSMVAREISIRGRAKPLRIRAWPS